MKTIMIVDDSLMMRINLKKMIERAGYQVIAEAANGQEAVEKYERYRPDLVTMDITMPVLDGITALKEIREIDQGALIVMISALGQELKIMEAVRSGARHFIVKPFHESDVVRVLGEILNAELEENVNAFAAR